MKYLGINRRHMPLCPFCACLMRAGAPCEVVMMFGLMALAHSRCVPADALIARPGRPPLPRDVALAEPVPVAQPP